MLAEAGFSETTFEFAEIFGVIVAFVLVSILAYLLLQRTAEFMMGGTTTSIREILFYTAVTALLCALLTLMERRRSTSCTGQNSEMRRTTLSGSG